MTHLLSWEKTKKLWIAIKIQTMLQEKNQMLQACWIKLLGIAKQKGILNDF